MLLLALLLVAVSGIAASSSQSCPLVFAVPPDDMDTSCRRYSTEKLASQQETIDEYSAEIARLNSICNGSRQHQTDPKLSGAQVEVSYADCDDVARMGSGSTGVYPISVVEGAQQLISIRSDSLATKQQYLAVNAHEPVDMFCQIEGDIGWTVIMRRTLNDTSFNRTWQEYKSGFGSLQGDYWLGLDTINRLTSQPFGKFSLWVELVDTLGVPYVFPYKHFRVGDESNQFTLSISEYEGKLPDPFLVSNQFTFQCANHSSNSQLDASRSRDCYATGATGCWWFRSFRTSLCGNNNLNAVGQPQWQSFTFRSNEIATVVMKIRRVN